MKKIIYLFAIVAIGFVSCDSNSEADVFVGEWMNKKNPNERWMIEKNGSTFEGTRTGETDFYKNKSTETWKATVQKNIVQLKSTDKNGSTLTYIKGKNEILRHPPGTVYKKVPNSGQ